MAFLYPAVTGLFYHPQGQGYNSTQEMELYIPSGVEVPAGGWPVLVDTFNQGFISSDVVGFIPDSNTTGRLFLSNKYIIARVKTTTVDLSVTGPPPIGGGMFRQPSDPEYNMNGLGDDFIHLEGVWAIQFLRSVARLFNINVNRIAGIGTSGGSHPLMWAAYRPDQIDPANSIPMRRYSSRPSALAVFQPQTWAHAFCKTVAVGGNGCRGYIFRKAANPTQYCLDISGAIAAHLLQISPANYCKAVGNVDYARNMPTFIYTVPSSMGVVGAHASAVDYGLTPISLTPKMIATNTSGLTDEHDPYHGMILKSVLMAIASSFHGEHSVHVATENYVWGTPADVVLSDLSAVTDYLLDWLEVEMGPDHIDPYIPLGYVPSTMSFVQITDHKNIPPVYDICHDLNSSAVFYDVPVSNTFPCRGLQDFDIDSSCIDGIRRHGPDQIIRIMNETYYKRALKDAENYLKDPAVKEFYATSASYLNVVKSLANVSGSPSGWDVYENFTFGKDVHKAYSVYTQQMQKHATNPGILASAGFNIISHAYGPLLFNNDFTTLGIAGALATTSLDSIIPIKGGSTGVLSYPGGLLVGTYPATNLDLQNYIEIFELRNGNIVSGIELVNTFGKSVNNEFNVFKLAPVYAVPEGTNFSINNTLIKSKCTDGFSRLRIDLKQYNTSSNYFLPDHEFSLDARAFIGTENFDKIGGGTIGIWLHTFSEGGYVWTWTKNRKWESNLISNITISLAQSQLAHTFNFPLESVDPLLLDTGSVLGGTSFISIDTLTEDLFKSCKIDFNTFNTHIDLPADYYKVYKQVHKPNQRYVLEIFKYPTSDPKQYAIFDRVNITDLTLGRYVEDYTNEDFLHIVRFFNSLSTNAASRVASITSGVLETSGGSRVNERFHPKWAEFNGIAGFQQYIRVNLDN